MTERTKIVWEGVTEAEAAAYLLRKPGDVVADSDALVPDDELLRVVQEWDQRERHTQVCQKVILHALHARLGTWDAVALATGRHKSTIHRWAHPPDVS